MRIRVRVSADSKKGRGNFEGDKPPVLTLVRRSDGRVRFIVCKDLQEADEEIAADGDGSVSHTTPVPRSGKMAAGH